MKRLARTACAGDEIGTLQKMKGEDASVPAVAAEDVSASDHRECVVELPESLEAPVCRGQVPGRMALVVNGEAIAETPLLAGCDVPESTYNRALRKVMALWSAVNLHNSSR